MNVTRGLEIHHDGDLPARSGLGSSSAFTVGLLNALTALSGRHVSRDDLATQALHVEQEIIREHVGSQDQICAAYGGFNRIEFRRNNAFDVTPIILEKERISELEDHLMLFFTGFSRIASEIAKSKIDNLRNRIAELNKMYAMVDQSIRLLSNGFLEDFGRLLHESWMYKRSLSPFVSTPKIDEIYEEALKAGAIGGKLLGAGGGGFLLLFAKPDSHESIRAALKHLVHVPFRFDSSGSKIVLYQPAGL